MLRLGLTVEDQDGPRDVVVGPSTLVAWERKTGRKMSDWAQNGIGAEDMTWLAWHAEKAAGNTSLAYDKYLDTLIDVGDVASPKATSDEGPSAD